ncbi:hypothetical protein FRACYDRAFT_246993 [Fragilariopsis cylindrus CCMP1102]|uniref:SET domain-containing protein n=1 Tax=Fragilariopsis cylindrus CCMP1102 TaxID=635003 RepID=A0A1E7EXB8_9STRA|nr:hypothetical protein FRACYDRAFT_246993 [Fragilariopsis cylindrus CCMP1102]|eukprot:OEU10497.1 hypothetical protein FRACYDRAFT_246993 [Fragilariopsis cylindrus CCMP1102]
MFSGSGSGSMPSYHPISYCNAADIINAEAETETEIEIGTETEIKTKTATNNVDSSYYSSSSDNNNNDELTATQTTQTCKNNIFDKDENGNNNVACGDDSHSDSESDSLTTNDAEKLTKKEEKEEEEDNDDDDDSSNKQRHYKRHGRRRSPKNDCKLYMAPSSIKGGGYGLFTSRDLIKGQSILGNSKGGGGGGAGGDDNDNDNDDSLLDGPNIPVLINWGSSSNIGCEGEDGEIKNKDKDKSKNNNYCQNPFKLFHNVWWGQNGGMSDRMKREILIISSDEDDDNDNVNDEDEDKNDINRNRNRNINRNRMIFDYQITFGALPNFHPYKSNLDFKQPSIVYDDYTYLKKSSASNNNTTTTKNSNTTTSSNDNNPLKGSFSYYKGKQFIVNSNVNAGEEILLNYGENFFNPENTESNSYRNKIPRRQDYLNAAVIIRKFLIKGSYIKKQSIDIVGDTTSSDATDSNDNDNDNDNDNEKDNNSMDMREITTDVLKSIETFKELLAFNDVNGYNRDYDDDLYYDNIDGNTGVDGNDKEEEDDKEAIDQIDNVMTRILSLVPTNESGLSKVISKAIKLRRQRLDFNDSDDEYKNNNNNNNQPIPSIEDFADAIYTEYSLLPPKTKKELKKYGMCLDHIIPGISKTPIVNVVVDDDTSSSTSSSTSTSSSSTTSTSATTTTIGRGAIAQRFIRKNYIIVPVPLLHLLDRSLLNNNNKDELLINYCFGPNAMYRWASSSSSKRSGSESESGGPSRSSSWDPQTDKTLKMTISEIAVESNKESTHRLLSMEIIALRDIKPGEENGKMHGLEHVKTWDSNDITNTDSSIPSITEYEMNQQKDIPVSLWFGSNNRAKHLRNNKPATSLNGRYQAMCWYKNLLPIDLELGFYHPRNPNHRHYWKTFSDAEIYTEYAFDAKNIFNMNRKKKNDDDDDDDYYDFWPCSVLAKEENAENNNSNNNNNKYTVRIYPSDYHHQQYHMMHDVAKHLLVKNYPRESIRFFTIPPNQGDQHLSTAFRHHIEIRDEIFPNQWKNLKR